MTDRSHEQTAGFVAERMFANDQAIQSLGIKVLKVGPGTSTITTAVRNDMLNGHQMCHGGLIATLADTAFAYACNSYNELTVASGFYIDFVAPVSAGDALTAHSIEVSKTGRAGVYDVDVINHNNVRVAVFRGRSYTLKDKPAVDS
jgi:acyl-CoA thioesterase